MGLVWEQLNMEMTWHPAEGLHICHTHNLSWFGQIDSSSGMESLKAFLYFFIMWPHVVLYLISLQSHHLHCLQGSSFLFSLERRCTDSVPVARLPLIMLRDNKFMISPDPARTCRHIVNTNNREGSGGDCKRFASLKLLSEFRLRKLLFSDPSKLVTSMWSDTTQQGGGFMNNTMSTPRYVK